LDKTFAIHKKPTKVTLTGLVAFGLYLATAVTFFRGNEYYFLILGGGVLGLVMLFIKSVACLFVSTYTVTAKSIETVTPVGGIIRIQFDELDPNRTKLSEAGLLLAPRSGESIELSVMEFSRDDIARLASHIGIGYKAG
jgi:hypothetical protein